ncbi:MAG: DUF2236 domain-containing protein [Nocardiaceae bacterium]|nr:DUF2236 domain-containing protein [Nocardiaceae bacterium]
MARKDRNAGLDPETDYEQINRNVGLYDFPWDGMQALGLALFRTYAVPSIGRLLHQTGEFETATQKRHDDTGLLLEIPGEKGLDSFDGRAAVRRINQMHHLYKISNDDMRYVLSTFVVVPTRWIEAYGWRKLSPDEVRAGVRYYQELGRRMGIKEIPQTYAEFAQFMDDYEAEYFGFDQGGRQVADATLDLLASFYPLIPNRMMKHFSRCLMDRPLLDAFHYDVPSALSRWLARQSLVLRGRFVALLPARKRPKYLRDRRRVRSYPHGFDLADLGSRAVHDVISRKSA